MKSLTVKNSETVPRWCSRVLACLTFPLIWVGGLVTTYDAGMAVPDWPTTYGYNLFLYPWQTWILGPWDLFIEHGHRLLGAIVGILTIGFVLSAFLFDRRSWLRLLAVIALFAVIGQGVLGGMRVILDDRQLAMVHGCVGPAFFAMTTVLVAVTSDVWNKGISVRFVGVEQWRRTTLALPFLAYFQLTVGATLRHLPIDVSPDFFQVMVIFHLIGAALLLFYVSRVNLFAFKHYLRRLELFIPSCSLLALLVFQISIGLGTWTVKYGWPHFLWRWHSAANYTIQAESLTQALTVTAHVATGSLILSMSVLLAIWSHRATWNYSEARNEFSNSDPSRRVSGLISKVSL